MKLASSLPTTTLLAFASFVSVAGWRPQKGTANPTWAPTCAPETSETDCKEEEADHNSQPANGWSQCSCYDDEGSDVVPPFARPDEVYETFEECECQSCLVESYCPVTVNPGMVGDPHLQSWSGEWFEYMGECDLKLLYAPQFDGEQDMDIHVRTTIRYDYSFIEAAAIKIGDDVLEVASYGEYAVNGVETALGPDDLESLTMGGYPLHCTHIDDAKHILKFDIILGENKNITLKTMKDWVGVQVFNGDRDSFGKVSGLMGSYDGAMLSRDGTDMHDDIVGLGQDWQVQPEEEMLFRTTRAPQAPQSCRLPNGEAKVTRRLGQLN